MTSHPRAGHLVTQLEGKAFEPASLPPTPPIANSAWVERELDVAKATANTLLTRMEAMGILRIYRTLLANLAVDEGQQRRDALHIEVGMVVVGVEQEWS
jgi:hypothetical protein